MKRILKSKEKKVINGRIYRAGDTIEEEKVNKKKNAKIDKITESEENNAS